MSLPISLVLTEYFRLQEEFRAKQANIFAALDKLYILHNAILAESRFIKAFFFYCCIVFLIYMLTSAKQTFSIRGQLYFGTISILNPVIYNFYNRSKILHQVNAHFADMFAPVGLCITLVLEIGLIKAGADDFDKQFWVMSKVFLVRMVFLGVATVQILHSIFTYRYVTSASASLLPHYKSAYSEFQWPAGPKPAASIFNLPITFQGL